MDPLVDDTPVNAPVPHRHSAAPPWNQARSSARPPPGSRGRLRHIGFLSGRFRSLTPTQQRYCILHELAHFADPQLLDTTPFRAHGGLGRKCGVDCARNAYRSRLSAQLPNG